jgi:hypothetical protein
MMNEGDFIGGKGSKRREKGKFVQNVFYNTDGEHPK